MDWTLIIILACSFSWCGFIVLVMVLVQRRFDRDPARAKRVGVIDGIYTEDRSQTSTSARP